MMKCPQCQAEERQVKSGLTDAGSQRYKCQACEHRYTPEPKPRGDSDAVRLKAVRMYVDGGNLPASHAIWGSAIKASQTGSTPSQHNCQMLLCLRRSIRWNWTSCIPSSSAKKSRLRRDSRRSGYAMHSGLAGRARAQLQGDATHVGPDAAGQTILQ